MPKPAELFEDDFNEFWYRYPRRVGKLAAKKAYVKARRSGVAQAVILDAIDAYVRTKPSYADFCHPQTWLNQGRWMDEVTPAKSVQHEPWVCTHTPRCPHRTACWVVSQRKVSA